MSVYKEGFSAVKTIESASKRIYPDACDFGALTNIGDNIWNAAAQLIQMYKDEDSVRKEEKYNTGITVTHEFSLMDEWSTGDQYMYRVTYVGSLKGQKMKTPSGKFDGYIYLELLNTIKGNKRMDD